VPAPHLRKEGFVTSSVSRGKSLGRLGLKFIFRFLKPFSLILLTGISLPFGPPPPLPPRCKEEGQAHSANRLFTCDFPLQIARRTPVCRAGPPFLVRILYRKTLFSVTVRTATLGAKATVSSAVQVNHRYRATLSAFPSPSTAETFPDSLRLSFSEAGILFSLT